MQTLTPASCDVDPEDVRAKLRKAGELEGLTQEGGWLGREKKSGSL